MTAHIFREYDIRGVADRDLSDDLVKKIGRGLGKMLRPDGAVKPHPRIVVCRDCRRSGQRLFDAMVHGLTEAGADVVDIGVGPTPLMYFGVHHLDADGGVMITGSHNPGEDNGFKIMRGKASFFGADIQKLREFVATSTDPLGPRGSLETCPIDEAYLDELRKRVRLPNLKPSTQSISLRLPVHTLERLKAAANARDVPYQSLIKVWLEEKLSA